MVNPDRSVDLRNVYDVDESSLHVEMSTPALYQQAAVKIHSRGRWFRELVVKHVKTIASGSCTPGMSRDISGVLIESDMATDLHSLWQREHTRPSAFVCRLELTHERTGVMR